MQIELGDKWHDKAGLFMHDPRYIAVSEDRERSELFDKFMREVCCFVPIGYAGYRALSIGSL